MTKLEPLSGQSGDGAVVVEVIVGSGMPRCDLTRSFVPVGSRVRPIDTRTGEERTDLIVVLDSEHAFAVRRR